MYSPRTWGWTEAISGALQPFEVFPTHVGMDRYVIAPEAAEEGIPHARGDGPAHAAARVFQSAYSPRTWGWTDTRGRAGLQRYVFPTHVGMDRLRC